MPSPLDTAFYDRRKQLIYFFKESLVSRRLSSLLLLLHPYLKFRFLVKSCSQLPQTSMAMADPITWKMKNFKPREFGAKPQIYLSHSYKLT